MKNFFLWAVCFFVGFATQAQFKTVASSPAFEEPETGYAKILILKDKRTAYLHITESDGMLLKMYGADHRPVFSKEINHEFGKLKNLKVDGIFEIATDIVVFISEEDKRTPVLYRLIIHSETGKLIKQEQIASLDKMGLGSKYAMAFGGVAKPGFIVRKDNKNHSSYAIGVFNSFSDESNKRVAIIQYDATHKEINRAYITTPGEDYTYINIMDLAVTENKTVHALMYGFNTRSSGGKSGEVYIATLTAGNTTPTYLSIYEDNYRLSTDGIVKYNANQKQLYFAIQGQSGTQKPGVFSDKTFFDIIYGNIDLTTKKTFQLTVDYSEVIAAAKIKTGKKTFLPAILQDFYINDDGGATIVLENFEQIVYRSGSHSSIKFRLGNIYAFKLDALGNQVASTVVIKNHSLNTSMMMGGGMEVYGPLEHYKRNIGATKLKGGNQFKSFSYFSGVGKDYIFLNDVFFNEEKIKNGKKPTVIQGLDECDAFSFVVAPGNIKPSRKYVFGKPAGKKEHRLAIFTISDYDAATNQYATLRLNMDGRKKSVKLVWLQPE